MARGQEVGVGKDQLRGNPSVFEQILGAVDVGQDLFQQKGSLNQARLQARPFICGDRQWDHLQSPGDSLSCRVVEGVEGGPVLVAHAPDPVLSLFEHLGSRSIQRRDKRLPVFTGSCRRQKALAKDITRKCNRVEQGCRKGPGLCRFAKVCSDHTN